MCAAQTSTVHITELQACGWGTQPTSVPVCTPIALTLPVGMVLPCAGQPSRKCKGGASGGFRQLIVYTDIRIVDVNCHPAGPCQPASLLVPAVCIRFAWMHGATWNCMGGLHRKNKLPTCATEVLLQKYPSADATKHVILSAP